MAYGRDERDPRERSRYDEQRERSSRFDEQRERSRGQHGGGERGFFERAGEEISSWFGADDGDRGRGRDHREPPRSRFSDENERGRFADEPQRRPYAGPPPQRREPYRERGGDMQREIGREMGGRRPDMDRDQGYRPMTGDYGRASDDRFERERDPYDYGRAGAAVAAGASAAHDRHYSEWRQRQIDEIDRDYDDYRREHQSKFESDFSNWRSTRQSKRQLLGQIREHMEVFGSDEQSVGKVDKVRGDRVILTKGDSPDGQHHSVNCTMIDRVEGDRVYLDKKADEAKAMFGSEERDRALYERDDRREPGAHILNRSFSGTY